jgi:Protein of unknown function (DUF3168)
MPDLRDAAQTAIVEALSGAPAVTLPVWQHVPEEQQPPFHVIDKMSAEPWGGKGGGLDRIEFDLLTVVREPGREHLTPHMATARAVLEGQALPPQPGVALSSPAFEADDDDLLEDGQTYVGVQRFSLFAQPA